VTEPRFCYIVLCHTRADAVARLVRRIQEQSPEAGILVRFGTEATFDPTPLEATGALLLASDIHTRWGDWSLVDAELECYARASQAFDADYYVIISGQDYPVVDLAAWEQETAARHPGALLCGDDPEPVTVDVTWRIVDGPALPAVVRRVAVAAAWRLTLLARGRFHVGESPRRNDHRWWIGRARRGERREVHKASQWKVLSREAVEVLRSRYHEHPEERAFVASCKVPDELYIATALHADGSVAIIDLPTTHSHFTEGSSSPEWLTPDIVQEAVLYGAPFARKLHPDADAEVLAALEPASRG